MGRIHWIDVARGIGILLVIYGHALSGDSFRYLIYAFHMPLFFFLSGIVFHHKKYETFLHSLSRDIKKILIPYFFFAFASFLIWILLNTISVHDMIYQIGTIFYGNGTRNYLVFNNILWFLPCLFVTKTFFSAITYLTSDLKKIIGILFIFSLLGYLSSIFFPELKLPFGIETALTAVVFFGAGYIWNYYFKGEIQIKKKYMLVVLAISLPLFFIIATTQYHLYGFQIDMRLNHYYNYVLFYSEAILGILNTLLISYLIYKNFILEYIGKHSLILFAWHLLLFTFTTKFLLQFFSTTTLTQYRDSLFAVLYSGIALAILLSFVMIREKLQPNFSILFKRKKI